MNRQYDVIVVGAGPAGSIAAMSAASAGVSTLLAEKHPMIGEPLCCAEAISTAGLTRVVDLDASWVSSPVNKVIMFGPDDTRAKIHHPDAGYVLDRKLLDRDLADMATRAGADLQTGMDIRGLMFDDDGSLIGVRADTSGESYEIEGKVIIAADGVESIIARQAGIDSVLKPKQMHSAYQYYLGDIDIEPETIEFHFGNAIAPGGYLWVFPKGSDSANVGIGINPPKSPRKKAVAYLNEFIEQRFNEGRVIEKMTGGVPSYMPDLPLYKDNLLLIGDAARLVDSLTGAGIANALLSGQIAGETAALMASSGISGQSYADKFNELKRKELKFYYHCREMFLKLTDNDFSDIIKFVNEIFGDRDVTAINPFEVVKQIVLNHPRLLKLGRHLVF